MGEVLRGCVLPDTFYPVENLCDYLDFGSQRSYRKGEAVLLPDEVLGKIIFVLSGRLKVSTITPDGREKFIYSAGQYCLMDRLFSFEEDHILIIAVEDSKVCFFTKEQLLMVFKQDEELIIDVLRNFASKVYYFLNQTNELNLYSPSARILRLLYELYKSKGKYKNNTWEINIYLPNKGISEITGLHFVTVSKIFGYLKRQKILKKTKTKIIIYDVERLKSLIDEGITY
ncbi:Crp/Fnr family transcriptional regulator [Dehalobacter restrictus]|uniref:Cyclic nucleotide-binding protein n=1 Tax=Dehalobacter restrictus (strain DSM 9455 / PER-K23) TaxID=871738 RepID=A0ABN4BXZ2_DEHRP|nr:Crp/Fnr family transcriptional regulator [Dehalobacter restrictus]AHF10426.1 cyclic nucleotide-binding protein [Dehalobacter restrictus DSM 9455]